jgi:ABC-type sugar transport system permease subunit
VATRAEELGRVKVFRTAKRKRGRLHQSNLTAYLMIAPMVVLLSIFVLYPLGYAVYLSGYRISFYKGNQWVGLDFYRYVLDDPRFWGSVRVGFKYVAMTVPAMIILSLLLASLIRSLS